MTVFKSKNTQEIHVPELRFLYEQDGPSERLLKQKLFKLFKGKESIKSAYLVKTAFGPNLPEGVVLGLCSLKAPDLDLVEEIHKIFASIFNVKEHLDILFLNEDQELQITPVCLPFYVFRSKRNKGDRRIY